MAKIKSRKKTTKKPAKAKKGKTRASKTVKAPSKKATKKKTTKTKTAKSSKPSKIPQLVGSNAAAGAIVGGTVACVCGYAPEEHGHDAAHPGWTGCDESDCAAYEADHGTEVAEQDNKDEEDDEDNEHAWPVEHTEPAGQAEDHAAPVGNSFVGSYLAATGYAAVAHAEDPANHAEPVEPTDRAEPAVDHDAESDA